MSSNSLSSSASTSSSSATSPHLVNVPPTPVTTVGPKVVRSRPPSRASPSEDNPTHSKFQEMLLREPWAGIVSSVKLPIHCIKEKYFIPHDYEVIIPRKFDRMHRPAKGFCPFSLLHFEAGFRLPLIRPVARILQGLDICPMQDSWELYDNCCLPRD